MVLPDREQRGLSDGSPVPCLCPSYVSFGASSPKWGQESR